MSVYLYSGTPGSYKSFHATQQVLNALKNGKNVICNYAVDYSQFFTVKERKRLGKFFLVDNNTLTVDYLLKFAFLNHQKKKIKPDEVLTLVVIDEASIMFNSRQFQKADRLTWVNFFANHRHYNYDIILIAQHDRMIDRQIRCLIEYDVKHRALKHWNFGFALLSAVFGGLYHCVEYWYPCNLKTDTKLCKFNRHVAECYNTMAFFDFFGAGKKKKKDKAVFISKSKLISILEKYKVEE